MNKGAVHPPPSKAEQGRRPPEPNPAPVDKPGVGTPTLKRQPPSEGQPGGQKG